MVRCAHPMSTGKHIRHRLTSRVLRKGDGCGPGQDGEPTSFDGPTIRAPGEVDDRVAERTGPRETDPFGNLKRWCRWVRERDPWLISIKYRPNPLEGTSLVRNRGGT